MRPPAAAGDSRCDPGCRRLALVPVFLATAAHAATEVGAVTLGGRQRARAARRDVVQARARARASRTATSWRARERAPGADRIRDGHDRELVVGAGALRRARRQGRRPAARRCRPAGSRSRPRRRACACARRRSTRSRATAIVVVHAQRRGRGSLRREPAARAWSSCRERRRRRTRATAKRGEYWSQAGRRRLHDRAARAEGVRRRDAHGTSSIRCPSLAAKHKIEARRSSSITRSRTPRREPWLAGRDRAAFEQRFAVRLRDPAFRKAVGAAHRALSVVGSHAASGEVRTEADAGE